MSYSFIDTSFGNFFSIISGLLGMAYPLVVQCIQRIDEKYHSDRLARRFRNEPMFKLFNGILVIAVLMAIANTFLLKLCTGMVMLISLIVIQAIVVLSLVIAMVLLFQLILVYYTPVELNSRILRDFTIADLSDLMDVCIYAAKSEDKLLFDNGYERIRKIVLDCQYQVPVNGNNSEGVEYPPEFWEAYQRIVKLACDDSHPTYFYHNNALAAFLYNQFSDTVIAEKTYFQQWIAMNRIADTQNLAWFMQYWMNAVAYISMGSRQRNGSWDEQFKLRHIMLGAMLTYKEKHEWLKGIMAYTYSQPPRFPLVPSSFAQIFSYAKQLLYYKENQFGYFGGKFYFSGMMSSVNDDGVVYDTAIKYLALLLIRLWSVNDYNITYSDPMALPNIHPDSIDDNEMMIGIAQHLRRHVIGWYKSRAIIRVGFDYIPKQKEVLNLLEKLFQACIGQNERIRNQRTPNRSKLEQLKTELIQDSRKGVSLPVWDAAFAQGPYHDYRLSMTNKMEDDVFTIGRNIPYANYPDALIGSLNYLACQYYNEFFITHQPASIYRIQAKDVFSALEALGLTAADDVVIAMGFYLGNYEAMYGQVDGLECEDGTYKYRGIEIISLSSQQQALLVMKKSALPLVEFVERTDADIPLVDAESGLYSNIDSMYVDSESDNILEVRKYLRLHYRKESSSYIRLEISYMASLGELDLPNLNTLPE